MWECISPKVVTTFAMGQGQGRELPFDVGIKYDCLSGKTIWSVHAGRRKVRSYNYTSWRSHHSLTFSHLPQSTGETVTVFMFDFTDRSEDEVSQGIHVHPHQAPAEDIVGR